MTILDKFMNFAKALPADDLDAVEAALAEIMESHSDQHTFAPNELAVLDQRVAEERPQYSDLHDIKAIFEKSRSE